MKTAIILSIFLVCVLALVVAETTDIMPPVPSSVRERAKIIPPEPPLVSPDLQKVGERAKMVLPESGLSVPSVFTVEEKPKIVLPESSLSVFPLPDVQEREKNVFEEKFLESPDFQIVQPIQPVSPPYQPLEAPSFNEVAPPQIAELNDFRGGLNYVSFPTHIAKNEAVKLINALWNPGGEMYKRPGYSEHSTSPEVLNFLYRYYQQDGDKWTMGGSDTALYFLHPDSSDWTYLMGTEGTEGRWDGTTFEDMFVGTHEGITSVVWDGSTFVTMGTSLDSFEMHTGLSNNTDSPCYICSLRVYFEGNPGWNTNEWAGYILFFPAYIETANGEYGWFEKKAIILSNIYNKVDLRHLNTYHGPGYVSPTIYTYHKYAKILSWFQVDTVWRTGTLDSATQITDNGYGEWMAKAWDEDFYWDSTFNYNDYIFEVISGEGEDKKIFLANWNYGFREELGVGWDTLAFIIPGYGANCFDITTSYRIYKPSFWEGSKFVENFDGSLWLGWTGVDEEQNKNIVIWSATDDLGNWPSENHIIIESKDGDFITGMAKFPGEYTDVPRQEMIVTKNNSLYKIVPSGDAYNFWLIQSGVGCVSNSAISPAEGILLFPDQHGVWAYDKRKPVSISAKIDPIFEEWDTENLEDASAVYNPQDRHYYISLPIDIDTVINGDFITTFYRDSSGTDNQFVHLITTLGGEQNGDIEITDDTASQYCDIASDTLGNYCVLVNETLNLYLFRFDSLDQRVGATIKVNDENNKVALGGVHVDMNNHGKIVVVWDDFRNDEIFGVYDIYGQCLRFSSGKVGGNFAVNSNYETNEVKAQEASVAINDDSVCVFVWQDWDDPTDFQTCIFAAIDTFPITTVANDYFKPFGGWKSPNGACELVQEGPQGNCANSWWHPDVDAGDTTFVIVCTDDPMESYGRYIVMNYSLDTLSGGITGQVEMNGSLHHSVSMNKKGRFVITWHHLKGLGDYEVYAIEYDIGGVFVNSYFRVDNAPTGISTMYPAVAINKEDQYCIVWWDERRGDINYYRCYTWEDGAVSGEALLNDIPNLSGAYYRPEITATNIWLEIDTTKYTLAWNIDHHGWSKESFDASAYCYQHSIFDEVKILFADPEDTFVYNYGTQTDDIDDPVFLTYQSPYFRFSPYPWQRALISYATIESYSDSGEVILSWYSDYGTLIVEDTLIVSGYDLQTIDQNGVIEGQNISLKITTSADLFKLAGYYLEYIVDKSRR